MTIHVRIVLVALLISLVGCLNFELDMSLSPRGRMVAATTMSAPVWLGQRWFGKEVSQTNMTEVMLTPLQLETKIVGNGAWIKADSVEQFILPFLSFKYRVKEGKWQLWGMLRVGKDELERIKEELGQRSQQIPKVHGERANRLAGAMFKQAQFKVYVRTPGAVDKTDGVIEEPDLVSWVVRLDDLDKGEGKAFLTISGHQSLMDRALACLELIVPPGDLD